MEPVSWLAGNPCPFSSAVTRPNGKRTTGISYIDSIHTHTLNPKPWVVNNELGTSNLSLSLEPWSCHFKGSVFQTWY